MAAELGEHVVEKRQPCGHFYLSRAVDAQPQGDRRLLGGALFGHAAVGHSGSVTPVPLPMQTGTCRFLLSSRPWCAGTLQAGPARGVAHQDRTSAPGPPRLRRRCGLAVATARNWPATAIPRTGILESSRMIRSRSATIERHAAFHLLGKLQRQPPCSLLQRVQMVRQRHALQHLYDLRRGDDVAEAQSGHRPGLRIRAHDYERDVLADQLEGRPCSELAVGLVDDDQARWALRLRRVEPLTVDASSANPVGLLGEQRKTIDGCSVSISSTAASVSRVKSGRRSALHHLCAGEMGYVGMEGVSRLEHGRFPARRPRMPGISTAAPRSSRWRRRPVPGATPCNSASPPGAPGPSGPGNGCRRCRGPGRPEPPGTRAAAGTATRWY